MITPREESSLLNPNQVTDDWQFILQWESMTLLCEREILTSYADIIKT